MFAYAAWSIGAALATTSLRRVRLAKQRSLVGILGGLCLACSVQPAAAAEASLAAQSIPAAPLPNIHYTLKWDRRFLADVIPLLSAQSLANTCTSIKNIADAQATALCGVDGATEPEIRQRLALALSELPGEPPQPVAGKPPREVLADELIAANPVDLQFAYQQVLAQRQQICSQLRPQIHNIGKSSNLDL
jgi:hypothetical protein